MGSRYFEPSSAVAGTRPVVSKHNAPKTTMSRRIEIPLVSG